jgi:hypothetical protein
MNNKKAPGEDGITAEIYKLTFNLFPKTALYDSCLKNRIFFEEMEDGENHTDHKTSRTKQHRSYQIWPNQST